jgi:hypothetical protein
MLRSFVYILYVIYKLGHLALRGKITIDCGAVRQIDRSVDNAVKAKRLVSCSRMQTRPPPSRYMAETRPGGFSLALCSLSRIDTSFFGCGLLHVPHVPYGV